MRPSIFYSIVNYMESKSKAKPHSMKPPRENMQHIKLFCLVIILGAVHIYELACTIILLINCHRTIVNGTNTQTHPIYESCKYSLAPFIN